MPRTSTDSPARTGVQLTERFVVEAPIHEVWPRVARPELAAACLAGASLQTHSGDSFSGSVKVTVGPLVLTCRGSGAYTDRDEVAHRVVVEAGGRDSRRNGAFSTRVSATLVEVERGRTVVHLAVEIVLTGRAARFGAQAISSAVRRIIPQLAERLATDPVVLVPHMRPGGRRASTDQTAPPTPPGGWYSQPDGSLRLFHWDGARWTNERKKRRGVFLSYARADEAAASRIAEVARAAGIAVWRDSDLRGGQFWWDTILAEIESRAVFVFVVSDHSLRSKPCGLEREYAGLLGMPIIPVQVGPVVTLRTEDIGRRQLVNYRTQDAVQSAKMIGAVLEAQALHTPLPEPRPPRPAMPYAVLVGLRERLDSKRLSSEEQVAILVELMAEHDRTPDDDARIDCVSLLRRLRARRDVTATAAQIVDDVLRTLDPPRT